MSYPQPNKSQRNAVFLKGNSTKTGDPYQEEQIVPKKTFLLICEGENTEPWYFKGFPVPTAVVLIHGGRNSKTSLVNYAIEQQKSGKYSGREIWCVFDYDKKPDEVATQPADFNNAIEKAKAHGLCVGWSNDAFELWFVLHYDKLDVGVTRGELNKILQNKWQLESYSSEAKKKEFCIGHYERLTTDPADQSLAVRRAAALHQQYADRKDYSNHCPCTTVYLLVNELNKNLKA